MRRIRRIRAGDHVRDGERRPVPDDVVDCHHYRDAAIRKRRDGGLDHLLHGLGFRAEDLPEPMGLHRDGEAVGPR